MKTQDQHVKAFLEFCESDRRLSSHTVKAYCLDLKAFCSHWRNAQIVWADVGSDFVRDYILYSVLHYDRGIAAAIASFVEEVRQGNTASPDALRALQELFADENSPGPAKASHFVLGRADLQESEDVKFLFIRNPGLHGEGRLPLVVQDFKYSDFAL